jgi:hypothetical protein
LPEWSKLTIVAGDLIVEHDGLRDEGLVSQDPGPVRRERIPIPGREGGHLGRHRVELVLEEDGEVVLRHVS